MLFNPHDSRHYSQKSTIQCQIQDKHNIVLNASSSKFSTFLSKLTYKYCTEFPWKPKTSRQKADHLSDQMITATYPNSNSKITWKQPHRNTCWKTFIMVKMLRIFKRAKDKLLM